MHHITKIMYSVFAVGETALLFTTYHGEPLHQAERGADRHSRRTGGRDDRGDAACCAVSLPHCLLATCLCTRRTESSSSFPKERAVSTPHPRSCLRVCRQHRTVVCRRLQRSVHVADMSSCCVQNTHFKHRDTGGGGGALNAVRINIPALPPPLAVSNTDIAGWSLGDLGVRVLVDDYGPGYLRFVGLHFHCGKPSVGVELESEDGKNDGTIKVSCTVPWWSPAACHMRIDCRNQQLLHCSRRGYMWLVVEENHEAPGGNTCGCFVVLRTS